MSPEKRFFLAIVLSFLFSALWMQYIQSKQEKNKPPLPIHTTQQQTVPQTIPQTTQQIPDKSILPTEPVHEQPIQIQEDKKEETFFIETDKYRMQWSTKGANLIQLQLKEYFTPLVDKTKEQDAFSKWLTVIPRYSDHHRSLELLSEETVLINNVKTKVQVNQMVWDVEKKFDQETKELIFTLGPINGIIYKKIFIFDHDENHYKWQGKIQLNNTTQQIQNKFYHITGAAGLALEGNYHEFQRTYYSYFMYPNQHGQPLFKDFKYDDAITDKINFQEHVAWMSHVNRYFGFVLHVQNPEQIYSATSLCFRPDQEWVDATIALHKQYGETVDRKTLDPIRQTKLILNTQTIQLAPDETHTLTYDFHVSTKEALSKVHPTYTAVDDYGFFGIISKFLLLILNIFYSWFHNYGVAIICLTILIKICLFPLTRKQQISMQTYQKKMQEFQPELKRLQERYKNDKNKLSQETMALYKKHDINPIPVGGCLPIFLQLPIFFGLYQALYYSVHLRQAPFLWIADLSQPDKLFQFSQPVIFLGDYFNLLPIVMTIVWVVQQKLAPKPDDPQMQQQQKMFTIMSIVFGFMFYNVASGLVLYWMIMNLLSIIEQIVIRRQLARI
ncbi:MAG TPA: membrane protein insertase YidC [Planctomycetota bacterium]|nr:membrane protein insertase YidC [Planctomycetota bacterium]